MPKSCLNDIIEDLDTARKCSSGIYDNSIADSLQWLSRASVNDTVPEAELDDLMRS